jgi:hypothetical protein
LQLTSIERRLRVAVRLVFALDLLFVLAMSGLVIYGLSHLEVFTDQGSKWFYLVQGIGLLGAIGTLVVLYNAMRSWRSQGRRIWGKLQATLFLLACLGFLWFALAGRLLHFTSIY